MQNLSIYDMIKMGEGQQLDFKHSVSDVRKIARSLVAFANTDGGTLLLGVKDNGKIAGIRSDEEIYMIETAAHLYCKPEVTYYYNLHTIEGKTIAEIIVEPSMQKPHSAPDTTGKFKVFIRKNDENLLANRVLLEVCKLRKRNAQTVLTYDFFVEKIFEILHEKERANIFEMTEKLNLSKYKTENIIIKMMLMNLIDIDITAEEIWYFVKNENNF
jgi:predicted HTH transcriptional regulator